MGRNDGQECGMVRMGRISCTSRWSPDGQECRMGRMGYTGPQMGPGWLPTAQIMPLLPSLKGGDRSRAADDEA